MPYSTTARERCLFPSLGCASGSSTRVEVEGPAGSAWGTDCSMTKPEMDDSSTVRGVGSFGQVPQPPAVARAIARMGFALEDGLMGGVWR